MTVDKHQLNDHPGKNSALLLFSEIPDLIGSQPWFGRLICP